MYTLREEDHTVFALPQLYYLNKVVRGSQLPVMTAMLTLKPMIGR